MKLFRYIALTGNAVYILWILYNGIDEGSRNVGRVEAASLLGLLILLTLNFAFLWKAK
jgi:hypothetical protein